MSKPSNPIVLDKFCGKQVYRVDYGVTEDKCSLYACNQNSIAVFPDTAMQNKEGKYGNYWMQAKQPIHDFNAEFVLDVKPFDFAVTSLSTCGDYLAIGTGDGIFKLMTFDFTVRFESSASMSSVQPYNLSFQNRFYLRKSCRQNTSATLLGTAKQSVTWRCPPPTVRYTCSNLSERRTKSCVQRSRACCAVTHLV